MACGISPLWERCSSWSAAAVALPSEQLFGALTSPETRLGLGPGTGALSWQLPTRLQGQLCKPGRGRLEAAAGSEEEEPGVGRQQSQPRFLLIGQRFAAGAAAIPASQAAPVLW